MAVPDHIRARKRPASRPTSPLNRVAARPFAQRKVPRSAGLTLTIAQDIRLTVIRLRGIQASVIVAAAALQKQNADLDSDIALALQHAAINPLVTEIERLAALLGESKEAVC